MLPHHEINGASHVITEEGGGGATFSSLRYSWLMCGREGATVGGSTTVLSKSELLSNKLTASSSGRRPDYSVQEVGEE